MSKFLFVNVIAAGPVDWKRPMTATGQPGIADVHMIVGTESGMVAEEHAGLSGESLSRYATLIASGYVIVGHSVEYHAGHLRAEMIARGLDPSDGRTQTVCTMFALTGHVTKRNDRKGWPTFDEACDHFMITRAGTETAADNARCLIQVFNGMQAIGAVPEPKIWKDRHDR